MSFRKRTTQEFTPDEILAKAEHFCAYRERSPKEVQQKLADLGAPGDVAEQIYSVLESEGYVDAERFALAFAGGKFRVNHWGRVRIRIGLRQHGIPDRLIEAALGGIGEEPYRQMLQTLLEKKRRQLDGDPNARQKIAAYLANAGFEQELIFAYL